MENHIHMVSQGLWFFLFYNLAFASALIVLLYEGHRRQFPMMRWILLLTISWMSFVAGSKMLTYSPAEWKLLVEEFTLPPTDGKNLLGGLIAGTTALIAGKYLLRFRNDFADAFAFAVPLSVAVQRIGCFLHGCCYGTPSGVPWAVSYPAGSPAQIHHHLSGLTAGQDLFSLPVHPVQLYETVGCIFVIFLLTRLSRRLKAPGSLMLASLILFAAQHFIVEFFRDSLAHTSILRTEGPLIQLQWFILLLVAGCSLFLFLRERRFTGKTLIQPRRDISLSGSFLVFLPVLTVFWLLSEWFTVSEILSLTVLLAVAACFLVREVLRCWFPGRVYRLVPAAILLGIVIMAQTYPANHADSTVIHSFKTISGGFASGSLYNTHSVGQGEGCDRNSATGYFKQGYTLGGARYSVTRENTKTGEITSYGVKAMMGQHKETSLLNDATSRMLIWGLTPFVSYDLRSVAVGAGLHMGNLTAIIENLDKEGQPVIPESGILKMHVYPQFSLRAGPAKWFFADVHIADHFPSALPGYRYQFGIGTGFGQTNQSIARIGLTGPSDQKGGIFDSWLDFNGVYFTGYFPLNNQVVLEPMGVYNFNPGSVSEINTRNGFQFSLGLGYRFGHTEKTVPVK